MKKKKKFIKGHAKPKPAEGAPPEAMPADGGDPAPGAAAEGAQAPALPGGAPPATAMGGDTPTGEIPAMPPMKKPSKKSMAQKMYGKV